MMKWATVLMGNLIIILFYSKDWRLINLNSEEEMAGHAVPESTGRQKRQVTKVSDRDSIFY